MKLLALRKGLLCLLTILGLLCSAQIFAGGSLLQINTADPKTHDVAKWKDSQIPIIWYMSQDGYPGSGISNTDLQLILEMAFDTWSGVPTSQVAFSYGGEINERHSGMDGKSLLTFTDDEYVFQSGELAFAVTYTFGAAITINDINNDLDLDGIADLPNGYYPAGAIYETDIVFNASHPFTNTGANSTIDIQAVALHEIGHLIGLSHSIISETVMHPFLSADIASGRMLKADDIAYASSLYPQEPAYSDTFGSISGTITNGFGGNRILGAHVYAVDTGTGKKTVGAYSLELGDYLIPGLIPGDYYIGMEPLDGEPKEADPKRINQVIKDTFDTNFTTEFYDANESNVETSPDNAQIISVIKDNAVTGIDMVTNTVNVPGVSISLKAGLNLFAFPVEAPLGYTAFNLFQAIGDASIINSIDRYNTDLGRYERVHWNNANSEPAGIDFAIERGEGYLVHMQQQKTITFEGQQDCPLVNAAKGFNLVGVPCPPADYSAYDLLNSIGPGVLSVQRYNLDNKTFDIANFDAGGSPVGNDFIIVNGKAYVVEMLADKEGVSLPGLQQIFPPFLSSISPGRAVIGTEVLITGQGFDDDPVKNDVVFNGVRAAVTYASGNQLVVAVPGTATTGPVSVAVGGKVSGNTINFEVESLLVTEADLQGKDLVDGQTVLGNLDSNVEQDRYSFIVSKGASITATATSDNAGVPDLLLFLEGPAGEVLTSDDNSGGGTNAKITRFEAPRTGRYTVVVTAMQGSGFGPYTLKLDIENTPPVPDVTVLSGDFQTGLMGTVLPNVLEILVTGANGLPVAGVPVDIVTNNADNIVISDGFTAETLQVLTNSSGIATINMTLPNTLGQFDITIEVPGYSPVTIKAATVATLPTQVELVNNKQNCGGNGCVVGQPVEEPYILRFKDNSGQPVPGVLVKFTVASGDGKLIGIPETTELSRTSDAAGEVSVTHRLGQGVKDTKTGLVLPQIVAATGRNPGAELLLFESYARAGAAATVVSQKTDSVHMTMGTAALNAIHLKVFDNFGNPVPAASVNVSVIEGGLVLEPGWLNGEKLPDMKTNENGEFVGALIADFKTQTTTRLEPDGSTTDITYGLTGVAPTFDEFGARVPLTQAYRLTLEINGVIAQFKVDVDMGPVLVALGGSSGADFGASQWVGKKMDQPVAMQIMAYQRMDECDEVPQGGYIDSDAGEWRNEDFSVARMLVTKQLTNYTYSAKRLDGNEDFVLLDSPYDDNDIPQATFKYTIGPTSEVTWIMAANIQMDASKGKIRINVETDRRYDPENYFYRTDGACLFNGIYYGYAAPGPLTDVNNLGVDVLVPILLPALSNNIILDSFSPGIEVVINDQTLSEPSFDPLQLTRSNSGIDLTKLQIKLNGNSIFDGENSLLLMNQYPNFMKAVVDGASVNVVDNVLLQSLSPNTFKFTYYPTASEINFIGGNAVDVLNIDDRVGNTTQNKSTIFTLP